LAGYVFNFAQGCRCSASLGGSAAWVLCLSPLTKRIIRSRWSLGRQTETSPNKVDAYQNNEVGKSGEDTQ